MQLEPTVRGWVSEVNKCLSGYFIAVLHCDSEVCLVDVIKTRKVIARSSVYAYQLADLDLSSFIDLVFAETKVSRNFKYELKRKAVEGLEKLTVWTSKENSHVIKEIAAALQQYPELTCVMLRCIKTGHNVSLANVDEKMKERYEEGYYS